MAQNRVALAALVAFAAALPGLTVQARPALYQCTETQELKVDFTPRKAQLHLDDKQITLQRIKTAHDAHYVNRKAGITLVARKGDLTLHEAGRTQQCKLQVKP
jgi:membrane-bound inhibitor of C-type lysozyme